jgi:phospholipid N-methyltransferase
MAVLTPTPDLAAVVKRAEARKADQPETETNGKDKARVLEEALKGGIQIVSAHQLFPTPSSLAERMVELADIYCNHLVLEPSAGTGRILEALPASIWNNGEVHAVEINQKLAQGLADRWKTLLTSCADFLEWDSQGITFDRILMNPPFERGADIRHILKARELLAPGGILVAICAGGPRQKETLEPLASLWEPLPAGTFEESGTNVNTVLLTIEAPSNSLP